MTNKLSQKIKDAFTEDIEHQAFIEGMAVGAVKSLKLITYELSQPLFSDKEKCNARLKTNKLYDLYHEGEKASLSNKIQYGAGGIFGAVTTLPIAIPLMLGSTIVSMVRSSKNDSKENKGYCPCKDLKL